MGNESNVKKLTGVTGTSFGAGLLYGVSVNTTLLGTMIIKESGTAVANFAATTPVGTYHLIPNGVRYTNLSINLSTADDVTAFFKVA